MTLLGIVALIVLVIAGLMVLRVKSDPMENESIRKDLADLRRTPPAASPSENANSTESNKSLKI